MWLVACSSWQCAVHACLLVRSLPAAQSRPVKLPGSACRPLLARLSRHCGSALRRAVACSWPVPAPLLAAVAAPWVCSRLTTYSFGEKRASGQLPPAAKLGCGAEPGSRRALWLQHSPRPVLAEPLGPASCIPEAMPVAFMFLRSVGLCAVPWTIFLSLNVTIFLIRFFSHALSPSRLIQQQGVKVVLLASYMCNLGYSRVIFCYTQQSRGDLLHILVLKFLPEMPILKYLFKI